MRARAAAIDELMACGPQRSQADAIEDPEASVPFTHRENRGIAD
jgi:hypothetical protein